MLLIKLLFVCIIMNLSILAWNVRGIMSSTLCLVNLLNETNCDIAIISEHKFKPHSLMYMNSIDSRYTAVSKTDSLCTDYNCTHGKGGISIMYKTSLQFSVEEIHDTNSDRIVGVKLKNNLHGSIFVFGAYLPADSSIDNYRVTLNALDDLYAYYSNYGKVIIAGDLNASCIENNIEYTNYVKSKELQKFIKSHSLYCTFENGTIPFKGPEYTFTIKRTMLDYILFDEALVRQVRQYEILPEGSFSSTSDHLPVIALLNIDENPHEVMNSFLKLPSWHKINDDIAANYQEKLKLPLTELLKFPCNSVEDVNSFYTKFVEILLRAANETIPTTTYNPYTKPYWNSDVKRAHQQEREMRKLWLQQGRPRGMHHKSYHDYKRAKNNFRAVQRLAYEKYIEDTYNDINNAAECDIRLFWKIIKRQKHKNPKIYPEIVYNGKVNNTPQTIANGFADYFHELYMPAERDSFHNATFHEINKAYSEMKISCTDDDDILLPGGPISESEIACIIKDLKLRKACGDDKIQNEHSYCVDLKLYNV